MTTSQFAFLAAEFPDEFAPAERAERYALDDPGTAIIHARWALESAVKWAFRVDTQLRQPCEDQLNAFLNEPTFKSLADRMVFRTGNKIQRAGNKAVHKSKQPTKGEGVEIAITEQERVRTDQGFTVTKADIAENEYDLSINRHEEIIAALEGLEGETQDGIARLNAILR